MIKDYFKNHSKKFVKFCSINKNYAREEYSKNLQFKNYEISDFIVEYFNKTKKRNYLELRLEMEFQFVIKIS